MSNYGNSFPSKTSFFLTRPLIPFNRTGWDIFEGIDLLCQMCTPTVVDASVVREALDSDFTDFEDALQHFSAKTVDADCIVTRNKKDFGTSEIPVYELEEFMALLDSNK